MFRTLDTASPMGNSKVPRATTFRDTAAAAMGTTEKPTGRAEPAGTSTFWASPPPPARHRPSTGDTCTLTWGQDDGDDHSQAQSGPTPHPCVPPHPRPMHAGSSQSGFYSGSCTAQASAPAAQSGEQTPAGGGAGGILGTLGAGWAWPHTGLRREGCGGGVSPGRGRGCPISTPPPPLLLSSADFPRSLQPLPCSKRKGLRREPESEWDGGGEAGGQQPISPVLLDRLTPWTSHVVRESGSSSCDNLWQER